MPIIRSSGQHSKTLEEFYQELIREDATNIEKKIGSIMLEFISMLNETFVSTTLYGLPAHDSLAVKATDEPNDRISVTVYSRGDHTLWLEYLLPEEKSPWKHAIVKGQASTIEEAKELLIISMTESEAWEENKELRQLYNKLKGRKTSPLQFTLWLEFEEIDPENWDKENEYSNILVNLDDGRQYALNVWTYKFLETAIRSDRKTGENLNGLYLKPPDLFVKELTRECIRQSIEDLLKTDDLEKVLNPTIFIK